MRKYENAPCPFPCVSSLFCDQCERNLTRDVLLSASSVLSCCQSLHCTFSSLSCTCNLTCNAFTLAQDIVPQRKTCCMVAERGSCPRLRPDHSSWKLKSDNWLKSDNCKLSWCRRRQELQYAIEQIRIPHVAGKTATHRRPQQRQRPQRRLRQQQALTRKCPR